MDTSFDILDIEHKVSVDAGRELTSMKVSAKVKAVFYPKSERELIFLYDYFTKNKLPFKVLGNGSNVLFSESAKDLIVISCKKLGQRLSRKDDVVTISASSNLSHIYRFCQKNELSGFEKLASIPGTLGGALKMNAGAFGQCISDNLLSVRVYKEGRVCSLKKEALGFGYRTSNLKNCLVLSARFKLKREDKCKIEQDYYSYSISRAQKQPKGLSLGSVFKNPHLVSAGFLIDKCGLKGLQCGGAKISEKHGNFIINFNNATYNDVKNLIEIIKKEVYDKFKIKLEEEIEII